MHRFILDYSSTHLLLLYFHLPSRFFLFFLPTLSFFLFFFFPFPYSEPPLLRWFYQRISDFVTACFSHLIIFNNLFLTRYVTTLTFYWIVVSLDGRFVNYFCWFWIICTLKFKKRLDNAAFSIFAIFLFEDHARNCKNKWPNHSGNWNLIIEEMMFLPYIKKLERVHYNMRDLRSR